MRRWWCAWDPGGVGKTTLSALLALRQAAAGRRALVLTIDPARRLADALGLLELTNDPIELTGSARCTPRALSARSCSTPRQTFDHMIALLVPESSAARGVACQTGVYQHISRSLSGTLEYMAVERVHELFRTGRFDRVVLDTPATGNAVDFLEARDRGGHLLQRQNHPLVHARSDGVLVDFAPVESGRGRRDLRSSRAWRARRSWTKRLGFFAAFCRFASGPFPRRRRRRSVA